MKVWDVPKHPNLLELRAGGGEYIGATRRSVDKTCWSSAQLVSYPQRNLLEQRAGWSKTYWSSAQAEHCPQQNLLEQRAGWSKTYWSSAQVKPNILEQRAGRFCNCLIFNIFSGFLHPYPFNPKHIQRRFSLRITQSLPSLPLCKKSPTLRSLRVVAEP